jgi:hypothetical protein
MTTNRLPKGSLTGADALMGAYKDMDRRYVMLCRLAEGSTELTEEARESVQLDAQAIAEEWFVDEDTEDAIVD